MRFTTGVVIGFAAGYYLGTRAGRERYVEIQSWLQRVQGSDTYQDLQGKVVDLAATGATLARDRLGGPLGGDGGGEDQAP